MANAWISVSVSVESSLMSFWTRVHSVVNVEVPMAGSYLGSFSGFRRNQFR